VRESKASRAVPAPAAIDCEHRLIGVSRSA